MQLLRIFMCVQDHSSNSSQLRIQALQFLGVALKSTSPAVWQKHVKAMAEAVTAAAGERYSMVSAEGLRVCESLVYVMRPEPSKAIPSSQKVLQDFGFPTPAEPIIPSHCLLNCMDLFLKLLPDSMLMVVPGNRAL